jgi:predicted nucleic acid-binding protein
MSAVVDSNVLIGLAKGGVFNLLHDLFGDVQIPTAVWKEVVVDGAGLPGAIEAQAAHGDWLTVVAPPSAPASLVLPASLDPADRDVVLLAEKTPAYVVTDDKAARRFATGRGLAPIHTVEIVLAAKQLGLIPSCQAVLDNMRRNGFDVRESMYQTVLRQAGETSL